MALVKLACCCRFDMFNVKLKKVKFDPNERYYHLESMFKNEPIDQKRYAYR